MRSARFERLLFVAMVLLALAHIARGYHAVTTAAARFGPLALGMTSEEVGIAAAGERGIGSDPRHRVFARDGRIIAVRLNQNKELAGIRCEEQGTAALACPAFLGVHIGDRLDRVTALLGPAERDVTGIGGEMVYPALGLRLQLADEKVVSIDLRTAANGQQSIWPIVLWRLFP